jgi:hypothetical protein
MATLNRELDFVISGWLAGGDEDPAAAATLASFAIEAGPDRTPLTEVEDRLAMTVRPYIHVPASAVAGWLLANWWRLRWEPSPGDATPSFSWRRAHSMAAIGGGYAWPAVELVSDGEFVQLRSHAEPATDVAGVRYLNGATVNVPVRDFEAAVDSFVHQVESRLVTCAPQEREISELRAELAEERSDNDLSRRCRLQALAGIDPGEAPAGWLWRADALAEGVGGAAADEVMAALPRLNGDLGIAEEAIEAIRRSPAAVDLSGLGAPAASASGAELPWQRATRLAADLRRRLGIPAGPIDDRRLGDLLRVRLPLETSGKAQRDLAGGFRNGAGPNRTSVLVPTWRAESQRFYLGRVIACALVAPSSQAFLPVTGASTALQKFERAFSQELLCPWSDLDPFTDEHGVDDEGVAEAAERFGVSQKLVLTTLVNRGKLPRERLAA